MTITPIPIHDVTTLWQARLILRDAYTAMRRLRQADPTIRCLLDQLDEMAIDLTNEMEAIGPMLPLGVAGAV